MSRRLVPWTFLSLFVLGVVVPLALHVRAFGDPPLVPDLKGKWDGFFFPDPSTGDVGLMGSVIKHQDNRRVFGDAWFLRAGNPLNFNAINFAGTVAEDDVIHGKGVTPKGVTPTEKVVFHGALEATGVEGGGAAFAPDFHFKPVRGSAARINAVLLHPFDAVGPDISGMYTGTFQSRHHRSFQGYANLSISQPSNEIGSTFSGQLDLGIGNMLQSFQVLATTSKDSDFVMIAQGQTGRLLATGKVTPPTTKNPTLVDALWRLMLNDRPVDFGSINFSVSLQ
jgi:hypothetical protein